MAKKKKNIRTVPKTSPARKQPTPPKAEEADHTPSMIDVDKRALETFNILFFRPSRSAQPGEVPWSDFLHAMASAGFAFAKLDGSVWHFRPSSSSAGHNIQFHEPHPAKAIRFRTARRIGRRLNRAFGWTGEMFRLRED